MLPPRRLGLTTGCSNAALLQRVPVEYVLGKCYDDMMDRSATSRETQGDTPRLSVASWSDNVFCFCNSASAAIHMATTLECKLVAEWSPLSISDDSKAVLFLPEPPELLQNWKSQGWKAVPSLKALGTWLQGNASSKYGCDKLKKKIMTAYFSNLEDQGTGLVCTES